MTGSIPDTDGSPYSTNQIIEDLWERIRLLIGDGGGGLTPEQLGELVSSGDSNALKTALDAQYVPIQLKADGITYNGDGTVASSTSGGIETVYTWNTDGTVNTETSQGLRKTWVYTNGLPTSSTVTAV